LPFSKPERVLASLQSLSTSDRRIVGLLLDHGAMPRAELASRIGVSRAAVTQMISSLERFGLIEEGESRKGLRGQPARPVDIRGAAGYSAGISFSHSYLDVAIIDLKGREIAFHRQPLAEPTPEAVATTARSGLDAARKLARIGAAELVGLGVAVPGDFRIDEPVLLAHRYFPAFDQLDVQRFFQERFDERIHVENDGRTCVMGERLAGLGLACRNFMLVHIGHGVGGGLFLDNRLYRGAHFNAGPIGTFFPLDAPRPSGQDLLETLRRDGIEMADFDALETTDERTQQAVAAWSLRAGNQLGPYLHHVANVIDPAFIIVGGRLPSSILGQMVRATGLPAEKHAERGAAGQPPVVLPSQLGARAGAIGAASIPVLDLVYPHGEQLGRA
jgi:predicted NBD/HSP70 family sugar kinase